MLPPKAIASLLMFALSIPAAAGSDDAWGYTIGQIRIEQQANFCNTEKAIDELAAIFQRFGPQTGFSALASSPDCALKVHSFTPIALKNAIQIKLESGDYYTINTIRVELQNGRTLYLLTTRDLQQVN